MKKRIICAALAVVMVFALMGCSVTSTSTKTETVTDANGHTTTTTTTTTNENGNQTTTTTVEESDAAPEDDSITATLSIDNETGVDIYVLKFTSSDDDNWGDDVLGELAPLKDGEQINFNNRFTYSPENVLWDIKAADENEQTAEFREVDVSKAADPEHIVIVLSYDAESESFVATVQ